MPFVLCIWNESKWLNVTYIIYYNKKTDFSNTWAIFTSTETNVDFWLHLREIASKITNIFSTKSVSDREITQSMQLGKLYFKYLFQCNASHKERGNWMSPELKPEKSGARNISVPDTVILNKESIGVIFHTWPNLWWKQISS